MICRMKTFRTFPRPLIAGTLAACGLSLAALGGDALLDGFADPPASARPHVWWHWMNGNVTKAGITADLEAMAKAGIGGAQIFDVSDGIPAGRIEFCSPAWFDMLRFANEEAKRLGIELALSNCSGWSSSGGPWVKPEDSMKHVVFAERTVRGGERLAGALEPPADTFGFYRDIAVLAFPRPAAEAIDPADYGMKVKYSPDKCTSTLTFDRPFPLAGVSIDFDVSARHLYACVKVEVSADGKTFRTAVDGMTVHTARYGDKDGAVFVPVEGASSVGASSVGASSVGADNVRARGTLAVKVTCDLSVAMAMPGPADQGVQTVRPPNARGLASKHQRVVAVRPEARARIPEFSEKAFVMRAKIHGYPYAADADQAVDPARILDLTSRLASDGTLDWTAPAGADWVVVRFGYASNGAGPRPATPAGAGLEVDKLSKPALARFFAGYVDKVLDRLGPVSPAGGLNNVLVDSYEVGCQNWTDGFEKTFRERCGYDIVPWLPLLTGRVVASPAETERVLADFRRVISDLFVENYAGEFRRLCHARGLLFSLEGYGSAPCDDLRYARRCDVPMGEFWAGNAASTNPVARLGGMGNCRFPGFIAHVWGQRFVGAESFTSGEGERWNRAPFAYKAQGDRAFCQGINRIIYHRWAHQPWTAPANYPGMTMGPHGSHFERTQTWWEDGAPAWLRYQTRCQWMLQEGRAAADILVFAGDSPTGYGLDLSRWHDYALVGENAFGPGRQWDVCGGEAVIASRAENGQVVAPSGARYKAIAVLPNIAVDPESQAALDRLAAQGVPVVPSAEVDKVLAGRGVGPDFVCLTPACTNDIRWIHRLAPDGSEVYFVALPNEKPVELDVSFRISGRTPEIWNPESGQTSAPANWQEKDGRTTVHLLFNPSGAAFVVFRKSPTKELAEFERYACASTQTIDGPWEVTFLNGRGAPATPVTFDALTPWNEHADDGIRYYSGSAIYRKNMPAPCAKPGERVVLDLGDVKNIATVTVNGKTFPVLWKPPYLLDITEALRDGGASTTSLSLEIKVTNLWPNRLIGDDALPCDAQYGKSGKGKNGIVEIPRRVWMGAPSPVGRHTFTTWRLWKKSDKLLPSGLIGPVRLLH